MSNLLLLLLAAIMYHITKYWTTMTDLYRAVHVDCPKEADHRD